MSSLKLYWSSSKRNFGDWLSPAICGLLSKRPVQYARPSECDLIAIGSILEKVKRGWFSRRVHVWGSGFIESHRPRTTRHIYHAVRGFHTARLLRGASIVAHGDPGLLCDLLLPNHAEIPKTCPLGLVPHYTDRDGPELQAIIAKYPHAKVLDVFSDPRKFLEELADCRLILSSSLHGLIASDALSIPNAWMKISDNVVGDGFKFRDYYSVFGIEPSPLSIENCLDCETVEAIPSRYNRPNIEEIKRRLLESFPFQA